MWMIDSLLNFNCFLSGEVLENLSLGHQAHDASPAEQSLAPS
jgi:hypothetical protein